MKRLWISQMGGNNFGLYRVLFNEVDEAIPNEVLPPTRKLEDAVQFCLGFQGEVLKKNQQLVPIEFNMQFVRGMFAEAGEKAAQEQLVIT